MNKDAIEVMNHIRRMNGLWTFDNKADELTNFFHPTMVAIAPNIRDRIMGGAACVKGWSDFAKNYKTTKWLELNPTVNFYFNDTVAIVTYDFEMNFERNGQKIEMEGRDMLTLIKENGHWMVVADQFSNRPV